MGEWMDYTISFANKEANLANLMVEKGFATIKKNQVDKAGLPIEECSLQLNLKAIDSQTFATGYKPNDNLEHITIGIHNNNIYYVNKWVPDDRLSVAISKCFPEDVLMIQRVYTIGVNGNIAWYMKNGVDTLKDGTPIHNAIYHLNPKLIKYLNNQVQINLPIGNGNEQWGKIYLPKENVLPIQGNTIVLLHKDTFDVSFKSGIVQMDTKDLVDLYYNKRKQYKEDIRKPLEIVGLPNENFIKRHNTQTNNFYYIVQIPCLPEISSNEYLSITLPDCDVNMDKNIILLGQKNKNRNAQIVDNSGTIIRVSFSNQQIIDFYEQYKNSIKELYTTDLEEEIENERE